MKCHLLISVLTALSLSVGCTAPRHAVSHPLAGVRGQAAGITETITLAKSDGKEVRKSLTAAQDAAQRAWQDSKTVKGYHDGFRSHLDRADYKIQRLLE